MKKKIIIIGAGFCGLSVLNRLYVYAQNLEITVIDKARFSNFLPMLPDVIGRRIEPKNLALDLFELSEKMGFEFIIDNVSAVCLDKKEISTTKRNLSYDYLVIASGSETNFYGNEQIKGAAYKLDDTDDACRIQQALANNDFGVYVIAGGGYTGIEVATNLRAYLNRKSRSKRIIIVERSPSILGPLPQWIKDYVGVNLGKLNIEVLTGASIEKAQARQVYLEGGVFFDNAMLIWAAGVKTAGFIQNLKVEKSPQGRIKVDSFLRADNSCFVAGDAACVSGREGCLRMAVQFAITQGECAGQNIINSIYGRKLKNYKPLDFGYIIPMANNKACGKILGFNLKGGLPILLHYLMCFWRTYTFSNKFGMLKNLLFGR